MICELGARGNLRLDKVDERRSPGLLVEGDMLASLLEELEEEASDSCVLTTVRGWVSADRR